MGYDINTRSYVDMFESGVIDPAKVSKTAITNAASIAGLLLITEALIVDVPEPPAPQHQQIPGYAG